MKSKTIKIILGMRLQPQIRKSNKALLIYDILFF